MFLSTISGRVGRRGAPTNRGADCVPPGPGKVSQGVARRVLQPHPREAASVALPGTELANALAECLSLTEDAPRQLPPPEIPLHGSPARPPSPTQEWPHHFLPPAAEIVCHPVALSTSSSASSLQGVDPVFEDSPANRPPAQAPCSPSEAAATSTRNSPGTLAAAGATPPTGSTPPGPKQHLPLSPSVSLPTPLTPAAPQQPPAATPKPQRQQQHPTSRPWGWAAAGAVLLLAVAAGSLSSALGSRHQPAQSSSSSSWPAAGFPWQHWGQPPTRAPAADPSGNPGAALAAAAAASGSGGGVQAAAGGLSAATARPGRSHSTSAAPAVTRRHWLGSWWAAAPGSAVARAGPRGSTRPPAAAAGGGGAGGAGGAHPDLVSSSRRGLHPPAALSSSSSSSIGGKAAGGGSQQQAAAGPPVVLLTVVPGSGEVPSPYKGAGWGEVMAHSAQRLAWVNPAFQMEVVSEQQLEDSSFRDDLAGRLAAAPPSILLGVGLTASTPTTWLAAAAAQLPTTLFWDSDPALVSRVDGYSPDTAGPLAQLLARAGGLTREGRAAEVWGLTQDLWGRGSSDDLLYIWLVLINQYVAPVPEVANTTKGTDLSSLACMIRHCGSEIVGCVTNPVCKAGLDCLQGCAFNDQVCQYRCIVSYETPQFGSFALCILQLHNCRNLDAQPPTQPDPAPMTSWRGAPLTHTAAEDMFLGWLGGVGGPVEGGALGAGPRPWSWLIAAGKNPAYDFFPCQHQLFYRGKGKGVMWYEPVFKAITLDGRQVWRRRRYRVRRGSTPGTFHFSVLDNGVTSKEYWRILDCADDLSFCLFYYSGAAAAAGLSYSGAVLGTPDGAWPAAHTARVTAALERAGIKTWELSNSDNTNCGGAPLELGPAAAA